MQLFDAETQGIFHQFDVAEAAIADAKRAHPDHADLIQNCFKYLCPSSYLRECADLIYSNHCREIIQRIITDQPLEAPTKTEVLMLLSQMSLTVKLNYELYALFSQLFAEIFPTDEFPDPMWTQSNQELLARFQRKIKIHRH